MEKIKKIKRGFTLIELIVVIVILGVLAAIAIPVVSGMLESSNQAADAAAAAEMSSALERWVLEYELYLSNKQGGVFTSDQDGVKDRVEAVLNVIGMGSKINPLTTGKKVGDLTANQLREFTQGLTGIDAGNGGVDGGKAVLDYVSKMPATAKGVAAVIQNYTKMKGDSIFIPKQKQMSFYYNIDAGVVIVSAAGKSKCNDEDLIGAIINSNVLSGAKDKATGKIDSGLARWVDITATSYKSDISGTVNLDKVDHDVVGDWEAGSVNASGVVTPTKLKTGELMKAVPKT